jgi:hypothetical protein
MKKAGSKDAFKQVDYEYVLKAASIAINRVHNNF